MILAHRATPWLARVQPHPCSYGKSHWPIGALNRTLHVFILVSLKNHPPTAVSNVFNLRTYFGISTTRVKHASYDDLSIDTETTLLLQSPPESSTPIPFDSWPQRRLSSFERIVVSRIDLRLIPLLCLLYVLNYLDRVCELLISGTEPRRIANVLTMNGLPLSFRIILLLRDSEISRMTLG